MSARRFTALGPRGGMIVIHPRKSSGFRRLLEWIGPIAGDDGWAGPVSPAELGEIIFPAAWGGRDGNPADGVKQKFGELLRWQLAGLIWMRPYRAGSFGVGLSKAGYEVASGIPLSSELPAKWVERPETVIERMSDLSVDHPHRPRPRGAPAATLAKLAEINESRHVEALARGSRWAIATEARRKPVQLALAPDDWVGHATEWLNGEVNRAETMADRYRALLGMIQPCDRVHVDQLDAEQLFELAVAKARGIAS